MFIRKTFVSRVKNILFFLDLFIEKNSMKMALALKETNNKKMSNQNPDEEAVAARASNERGSLPMIFKLNIHCFDEMFEYLSLKDLLSFGQTCKGLQNVAGKYFKRN